MRSGTALIGVLAAYARGGAHAHGKGIGHGVRQNASASSREFRDLDLS